jgi:hypothetical protein
MFSGHLHPWKPVVNSWWLNSNKGTKTLTGLSQKHLNKPSDLFVVCGTGALGRQIARAYSKRRLDCGWRLENRHSQQLHGYSHPDLNYRDPRLCSLN